MLKCEFKIDGEKIEEDLIQKFNLRSNIRNLRYSSSKKCEVLNFVGFIMEDDMMLVALPKHYATTTHLEMLTIEDIRLLFKVLLLHQVENIQHYIGSSDECESTFPFRAFYSIYSYYLKYGLYKETNTITKPGFSGKIDWKETMRKSDFVISDNNLIYMSLYSKKMQNDYVFLSECMSYVISYTLTNYAIFIQGNFPESENNFSDVFSNREYVLARLQKISSQIFKDIDKRLVRDLIDFFTLFSTSGGISLKHYNFELVWESMVEKYLNNYFIGMSDNGLLFSDNKLRTCFNFKKGVFYVDHVHPRNRIEPDHYFNDGVQQFIFDSKYYSKINELNYKQVAYYTFLKNRASNTYNALIIPTEYENSESISSIHFELKETFYKNEDDQIKIWEYYLNIKNAMKNYIIN